MHSMLKTNTMVFLSTEELVALQREIKGQGGFQSLLKALRNNMCGNVLTLTPTLHERVVRYATKYGGGGFEQRLGGIVMAASRSRTIQDNKRSTD